MTDPGQEVEVVEVVEAELVSAGQPGPRARLSDAARRRLRSFVPEETKRAYNREWAKFVAWCEANGEVPLPCGTDTLTNWVASRADAKDSLTVIKQGIGAVMLRHRSTYGDESKLLPVTTDAWRVVTTYRRELVDSGWRPTKAATVTPEEFRAMVATIAPDTPTGVRDRAILAVTLTAFFRRSNTMRLNVEDVEEMVVETEDGTDTETVIKLFSSRSKTDQKARGRKVELVPGEHALSDAVDLLLAWICELQVQGITTGPLFRRITNTGKILDRRLSDDHVRLLVRDTAKAAGLSNKRGRAYRAHSLRASGVTMARRAGKPWSLIREHGDWRDNSPVVMEYERPEEVDSAVRDIGL